MEISYSPYVPYLVRSTYIHTTHGVPGRWTIRLSRNCWRQRASVLDVHRSAEPCMYLKCPAWLIDIWDGRRSLHREQGSSLKPEDRIPIFPYRDGGPSSSGIGELFQIDRLVPNATLTVPDRGRLPCTVPAQQKQYPVRFAWRRKLHQDEPWTANPFRSRSVEMMRSTMTTICSVLLPGVMEQGWSALSRPL